MPSRANATPSPGRRKAFFEINGAVSPESASKPTATRRREGDSSKPNSNATTVEMVELARVDARTASRENLVKSPVRSSQLTDYEREREVRGRRDGMIRIQSRRRGQTDEARRRTKQARVRRNNELLATLKVRESKDALEKSGVEAKDSKRKRREKREETPAEPTRRSARMRGESSKGRWVEIGEDDKPKGEVDEALECHLTCDEYCAMHGLEPGPKMVGGFRGWVEETERIRLGIAENANKAWELNGGGSGDRRPGKGEQARDHARRMLYKNPNAYFYRHTGGEEQRNGDWDEGEIERFVEVAKQYGCGDKWGLFASYIPGRVGYQCSAAYRHVIIPRGLLRDDSWRLTPSGEAIFAGRNK